MRCSPSRARCGPGAARVGDPLAVLPVLFAMLWRGRLSVDLDSRVLDPATVVRAAGAADDPASDAASRRHSAAGRADAHSGRVR